MSAFAGSAGATESRSRQVTQKSPLESWNVRTWSCTPAVLVLAVNSSSQVVIVGIVNSFPLSDGGTDRSAVSRVHVARQRCLLQLCQRGVYRSSPGTSLGGPAAQ